MRLAKIKIVLIVCLFLFSIKPNVFTQDTITTTPLINLEELKPSFEEIDNTQDTLQNSKSIKEKKIKSNKKNVLNVKLMGLDKITAKTSEINIKLGEKKIFGLLEIKVLKCGYINSNKIKNDVAYIQVKDLSEDSSEKVFIFNGWTFSSNPELALIDHAIYDLWLIECENA